MEIKYFRLIKAIAEEGSIANSTEKLFLTQSALSHQLKELEEQLGFKVFLRTRNKWELTEEGNELYGLGNTVLASIEKGFENIDFLTKKYPQIPIVAISSVEQNEQYNIDYEIGIRNVAAPLLRKSAYSVKWREIIASLEKREVLENVREEEINKIIRKLETLKDTNRDKERIDLLKKLKGN